MQNFHVQVTQLIQLHEEVAQRYEAVAAFHGNRAFRLVSELLALQHRKMIGQLQQFLPTKAPAPLYRSKVMAVLRFCLQAVNVLGGVSRERCLRSEMYLRSAYDEILNQSAEQPEDFLRWAVLHQQRLREHLELLLINDARMVPLEL